MQKTGEQSMFINITSHTEESLCKPVLQVPFPPGSVLHTCPRLGEAPGTLVFLGFPCGSTGKELACNVGDLGSIPMLGRSPGEVRQPVPVVVFFDSYKYHCVSNSLWPGEFHGHVVAKSWT